MTDIATDATPTERIKPSKRSVDQANASDAAAPASTAANPPAEPSPGIGGEYAIVNGERVLVKPSTEDNPNGNRPRDAEGNALN